MMNGNAVGIVDLSQICISDSSRLTVKEICVSLYPPHSQVMNIVEIEGRLRDL